MQQLNQLLKSIELTEPHISTGNDYSIAISRLNGDSELDKSDLVFFSDSILTNWNQNAMSKDSIYHARAIELMRACKKEGMTRTEFRAMVEKFIANQEFTNWSIANVMKYREKSELHNEDWYKKELATTEFNPEHFEIFLVDGVKWYCYKADADKVKLSNRVQIYKPKMIPRVIEKEQEQPELSQEEIDYMALHSRIFELEAENERLHHALLRKEK